MRPFESVMPVSVKKPSGLMSQVNTMPPGPTVTLCPPPILAAVAPVRVAEAAPVIFTDPTAEIMVFSTVCRLNDCIEKLVTSVPGVPSAPLTFQTLENHCVQIRALVLKFKS